MTVSVKLPDFPVMVTVDVLAAAEAVTANVRMQLAAEEPELKDAVTPFGKPARLNMTVLEKPFCGVKVRVVVPVAPGAMLRAVGEADKANVGGLVIVSVRAVLLLSAPDVPVIVTVEVAAAALLVAWIVTTLVRAAVTGPKVAVTPAGSPEADSATALLKPF